VPNSYRLMPTFFRFDSSEAPIDPAPLTSERGSDAPILHENASSLFRLVSSIPLMDAMDVQESDAAPEGLGMAEGISDGAQMVRYVNPAQCV